MKLLGDRILVKKILRNESKVGNILVSDKYIEDEFKVILVGNKTKVVNVGDVIRKYKFAKGKPIVYENQSCLLLKEDGEVELIVNKKSEG